MLSFSEIRALTSTDNKELASVYSPDGEYVVFHRYSTENCLNNIWAKNLNTQKETQLTKNFDAYGRHSFSKDGKQLVFVRTTNCDKPLTQNNCYQLMSLDFHKALKAPQPIRVLLECKNSEIKFPHWLNNNDIALLQRHSNRWQLISYSVSKNKSQVLYSIDDGNIIYFDYSAKNDRIALIGVHNDGKIYVEKIKPNGEVESSNPVKFPKEILGYRFIYPKFSAIDNQLIFSTGKQLFTLSFDGEVNNISIPLDKPMGTPKFHPSATKMLAIKGFYDSDIVAFPVDEQSQNENNQKENNRYNLLERSTLEENNGIFQSNGNLLAFASARSGEEQIWLKDNDQARQLTHYPMDNFIQGFTWALDGQSLLANVRRELKEIALDGSERSFKLKHPIETLFYWDSNKQTALANVRVNGVIQFAEINLANLSIRIINEKQVDWAQKTSDGQLIYTDHQYRFWQSGVIEDQLIEPLIEHGSDLHFVIKDKVVYGVNSNFQLWSYDLQTQKFEVIRELQNNIDYITDIKDSQIVATLRVASRKEVIELIIKK